MTHKDTMVELTLTQDDKAVIRYMYRNGTVVELDIDGGAITPIIDGEVQGIMLFSDFENVNLTWDN